MLVGFPSFAFLDIFFPDVEEAQYLYELRKQTRQKYNGNMKYSKIFWDAVINVEGLVNEEILSLVFYIV